jgi:transcription-repair coupling factor (superfamily II helicase)
MDRLLCGDVGYGKTEVAMRAAIEGGRRRLPGRGAAPTTILADQHWETFRAASPAARSRSRCCRASARRRGQGGQGKARRGTVDILIGTHRCCRRTSMPRLALLIVDEEQRFGVAQKETLKQWKKHVMCSPCRRRRCRAR